ncbi:hypothetical protein ALC56_03158 [Trachymyrmex septentrionalis]|uniref:Uncharacterized protein n=1 Tax=Trachymyrmex septentrionalis TaxID=34720 RepID=A0A151JZW4_9HYME|nr:hypothetical protein ALC56_03158 [Trachymyrmex septentrionalis]
MFTENTICSLKQLFTVTSVDRRYFCSQKGKWIGVVTHSPINFGERSIDHNVLFCSLVFLPAAFDSIRGCGESIYLSRCHEPPVMDGGCSLTLTPKGEAVPRTYPVPATLCFLLFPSHGIRKVANKVVRACIYHVTRRDKGEAINLAILAQGPDRDTCPLMAGTVTGWRSLPSQPTVVSIPRGYVRGFPKARLPFQHLSAGGFLCGYEKLGSCWSYRRCNTLRGTGRYVINIHKRRNGAMVGDEGARGRDTSDIMRPELCEQTNPRACTQAVDTERTGRAAECGALCSYAECISMSHSSQTIIKSDIRKEDVAQQRAYSSRLNSPGRKRGFVSTEAGECVPRGREEGRRREWKINVAMMPRV